MIEGDHQLRFANERPLFQRLLHLLMCLTVLVCPAMGGQCCGGADDLQTATSTVSGCDGCCCHDDADDSRSEAPVSPCPNECHDCFCEGALPPTLERPTEQLNFDALVAFVVVSMDAPPSLSVDQALGHRDFYGGSKPPSGRALLTSYCTLLL